MATETQDASGISIGVLKESDTSERRVALVPESVTRLKRSNIHVLVEKGAGTEAFFGDDEYASAGATVADRDTVLADADVIVVVNPPDDELAGKLRKGQWVAGLMQARTNDKLIAALKAKGVTVAAIDMLPRTLSNAQSMDALTSQNNVAGYKAVLVAAATYGSYFPMLMTAAGTIKPAKVLVMGAGVAGLQAIGTAHRLGAVVSGYDVRSATRDQVESLGASFLDLGDVPSGEGEGGYARQLTPEEQKVQQAALAKKVIGFDIVITTAQVPGRRPPELVTKDTLDQMKRGALLIDLGASSLGGNVAGSKPGEVVVTDNGVTVVGAGTLPSSMPNSASQAYGRNVGDFVTHFVRDGALTLDGDDPIDTAVIVTGGLPAKKAAPAAEEKKAEEK